MVSKLDRYIGRRPATLSTQATTLGKRLNGERRVLKTIVQCEFKQAWSKCDKIAKSNCLFWMFVKGAPAKLKLSGGPSGEVEKCIVHTSLAVAAEVLRRLGGKDISGPTNTSEEKKTESTKDLDTNGDDVNRGSPDQPTDGTNKASGTGDGGETRDERTGQGSGLKPLETGTRNENPGIHTAPTLGTKEDTVKEEKESQSEDPFGLGALDEGI